MAKKKFFESDDQIVSMINDCANRCGLPECGVNIQVMSTAKQKEVIKVGKASDPTEFLTKTDNAVQFFVYEEVFLDLDEELQRFLVEFAFDGVYYDSDKDKVVVEKNPYVALFDMRRKYGERAVELLEAAYLAVKQKADKDKEE